MTISIVAEMLPARFWINDRLFFLFFFNWRDRRKRWTVRFTYENVLPLDTDDRRKLMRIVYSSRLCAHADTTSFVCVCACAFVFIRLFFIPLRMPRAHCYDCMPVCVRRTAFVVIPNKTVAYVGRCVNVFSRLDSHSYILRLYISGWKVGIQYGFFNKKNRWHVRCLCTFRMEWT